MPTVSYIEMTLLQLHSNWATEMWKGMSEYYLVRRLQPDWVSESLEATGRREAAAAAGGGDAADQSPSCSREARKWNEATATAASVLLKGTGGDNNAS